MISFKSEYGDNIALKALVDEGSQNATQLLRLLGERDTYDPIEGQRLFLFVCFCRFAIKTFTK